MKEIKEYSDIFVSYRRSDGAAFAEGLVNSLKIQGYRVFFDKKSMEIGADFPPTISNALKYAKEIILVVSKEYFGTQNTRNKRILDKNDWVRRELLQAMRNKDINILPILIDCLPPSSEDLPYGLKKLSSVNYISYNKAFDTYEKIIDKLIPRFHYETCENAKIGIISDKLSNVNVYDTKEFNIACKNIIDYLEDEQGQNALKHILEFRDNNENPVYPESYRYIVFYTLFSYYRRMHQALKLVNLVEKYGITFMEYPFTQYVYMEYHHIRYDLELDKEKSDEHLKKALKFAKKALDMLPENNGIIHAYCLAVALAGENKVNIAEKDIDLAFLLIDKIIHNDPEYALYYCTKGRLLANLGKYESALLNVKRAETLESPKYGDWILRISNYYRIEAMIQNRSIAKELFDAGVEES